MSAWKTPVPTGQERPASPQDGELWRLEWAAYGREFYADNLRKAEAEALMAPWLAGNKQARLTFCGRCPSGPQPMHDHDATEGERGWPYRDITRMWMIPMRECL